MSGHTWLGTRRLAAASGPFRALFSFRLRPAPVAAAFVAILVAAALSGLSGCNKREDLTPEEAELRKGRTLYTLRCASCHHPADPRRDGGLGPAIAGSSLDLLDAKLNRGTYPDGYTPKRPTSVMQRLPATPEELAALQAFLASF